MGDIVPFNRPSGNTEEKPKKQRKRKKSSVEFPMVFNQNGMGLNPYHIKEILVRQDGTLYVVMQGQESPSAAIQSTSYTAACELAESLQEITGIEFGTEVTIKYDES